MTHPPAARRGPPAWNRRGSVSRQQLSQGQLRELAAAEPEPEPEAPQETAAEALERSLFEPVHFESPVRESDEPAQEREPEPMGDEQRAADVARAAFMAGRVLSPKRNLRAEHEVEEVTEEDVTSALERVRTSEEPAQALGQEREPAAEPGRSAWEEARRLLAQAEQLEAEPGLGRIVALYYVLILFIPESLTYSVTLFPKRQCGRTLG